MSYGKKIPPLFAKTVEMCRRKKNTDILQKECVSGVRNFSTEKLNTTPFPCTMVKIGVKKALCDNKISLLATLIL